MSARLTFIRIYSGTLDKGTNLINTTKDKEERISRLLEMHANQRKERDEFYTGDIAACIGLKIAQHRRYSLSPKTTRFFLKKWNSQSL